MKTFLILAGLVLGPPAAAQMGGVADKAPACVAPVVVSGFEGWGKSAPASQLKIGGFSSLALAPADAVKFEPPLNHPSQPGQMGGVYQLTFDKPGTYRIALGAGAWIDVVGRGAKQVSAAHMHGPACSGIAKIVDYKLEAGEYVVQFSAASVPRLPVMVIGG